ncbi:MAG TPA: endonuclease/exonuclease/phosphatase family protein [Jiangellaceae bacterium]|nr:endonuclease/exonuclease/phosphatase family protein [Jiangellaceae bacterium]
MRAVTFNIHHGVDGDGRLDLERIAETIESLHADVVAMQEVDRRFAERSEFADQARMLSRRLGMRLAYGAALNLEPADQNELRRQYGNAILARYPIVRRNNVLLPRTAAVEQRALLRAQIDIGDRLLDVYTTHLEAHETGQRALQAGAVATAIANEEGSRILLADLNTRPDLAEMAAIAAVLRDGWAVGTGRGFTYPAAAPSRRIDVVMHSVDLRPSTASVVATTVSDHRPVVVDFE